MIAAKGGRSSCYTLGSGSNYFINIGSKVSEVFFRIIAKLHFIITELGLSLLRIKTSLIIRTFKFEKYAKTQKSVWGCNILRHCVSFIEFYLFLIADDAKHFSLSTQLPSWIIDLLSIQSADKWLRWAICEIVCLGSQWLGKTHSYIMFRKSTANTNIKCMHRTHTDAKNVHTVL